MVHEDESEACEPELGREFLDEYYNLHRTVRELSRGEQDVVYETDAAQVLLKLAILPEKITAVDRASIVEKKRRRYHDVRLLPVPQGLHIAMPLAALQDELGYGLEYLQGMEPLQSMLEVRKDKSMEGLPAWVTAIKEPHLQYRWAHYQRTGGLRRRLLALARTAEILAGLHLQGILYGDISPSNIFISDQKQDRLNAWLIDADNLRWAGTGSANGILTPWYGAPEMARGESGPSFYTDSYAFAVTAFQVLTTQLPFAGALLEEAEDGWDLPKGEFSMEERAQRGEIPWVDELDDTSNGDSCPAMEQLRSLLVAPALQQLFQASFGKAGRTQPWTRPPMAIWARELARAADDVVHCENCGTDYYGGPELVTICPYCDHEQKAAWLCTALQQQADGSYGGNPWRFRLSGDVGALPLRLLQPYALSSAEATAVHLEKNNGRLILRKDSYGRMELSCACQATNGRFNRVPGSMDLGKMAKGAAFYLLVGPCSSRLVRCEKGCDDHAI